MANEDDKQPDPTDTPDRTAAEVSQEQAKQQEKDRRAAARQREKAEGSDEGVPVARLLANSQGHLGVSRAVLSGGLALAGLGHRKNLTIEEAREAAEQYAEHEVEYEN